MEKDRLLYLLENDKKGLNSPEEAAELEAWYRSADHRPAFTEGLSVEGLSALEDKMFARILTEAPERTEPVVPLGNTAGWFNWGKMAAAILLWCSGHRLPVMAPPICRQRV